MPRAPRQTKNDSGENDSRKNARSQDDTRQEDTGHEQARSPAMDPGSALDAADAPAAATSTNQDPEDGDAAAGLSFRQAQTALELCLAQLQDGDLDVEAMADLYQRALAYSRRCEAVLQQVEQDVMQWDPQRPDQAPEPFAP